MSCHVMSCHVMSCHVTSRHVTSRHVTSRHVTSRYELTVDRFVVTWSLFFVLFTAWTHLWLLWNAVGCDAQEKSSWLLTCHRVVFNNQMFSKVAIQSKSPDQHNNIPMQTHMHADMQTHTKFKVLMLNRCTLIWNVIRSICVNGKFVGQSPLK